MASLRVAAATIRSLSRGFRSHQTNDSALMLHRTHWIKFNLTTDNLDEIDHMLNEDKRLMNADYGSGKSLIHLVCDKGSVDAAKLLIKLHADLNVTDDEDNTPVHIAVIRNKPKVLKLLLKNGASPLGVNRFEMAPIHLAVIQQDINLLEILLEHGANPEQTGSEKRTPLHFAAMSNDPQIVNTLMESGAEPLRVDMHGKYPIHLACKMTNPASLKAIIIGGVAQGYSTSRLMSVGNRDGKLPIHTAVNTGDIEVTKVCMESGSPVKAQQKDGMTCVHLACSLGHLQMVQAMAETQPENFAEAISLRDSAGMTPLHRVVIFDQADIVKFLLQKRADIEAEDDTGKTPLLVASAKGNWSSVKELLAQHANTTAKDIRQRNLLHIATRSPGGIKFMERTFGDKLKQFVDEPDEHGWTPFHYACYDCHIMAVSILMSHEATLNAKDNCSRTPLHLAATDVGDNTPLHYASGNGWHACMQALLEHFPYMINVINSDGDTPLHVAGKYGYANAICLLLNEGAKIYRNKLRLTFMDFIITGKHHEAAEAIINHDRWEEVIRLPSKYFGKVFLGLVEYLPDACEKVLNRCYETSDSEAESQSYWIYYNFIFLETPLNKDLEMDTVVSYDTPFYALRKMVEWNRVECLAHPVCVAFLKSKWLRYGGLLYTTQQCIYLIFMLCCTSIVVLETTGELVEGDEKYTHVHDSRVSHVALTHQRRATCLFATIYSVTSFAKDLSLIFIHRKRDTFEITKLMAWTLYVSSTIFTLMPLLDFVTDWQFQSGVVAIFLGWFYLLIILQRLDFFGIYVVMFLEICNTFVRVLCVFFVINVAFSFAFYMLLYSHPTGAFSTPLLSMMKTFMMLVEQDYLEFFVTPYMDDNNFTLPAAPLTFTVLIVYLLVMPILLMNLLIGLAVGDIEQVRKDAQLKRLTTEVECYFHIESKLPECLQKRVTVYNYKFYPNTRRISFLNIFTFSKAGSSPTPIEQASEVALLREKLVAELEHQNEWLSRLAYVVDLNSYLLKKLVRGTEQGQEEMEYEDGGQEEEEEDDYFDRSYSGRFSSARQHQSSHY